MMLSSAKKSTCRHLILHGDDDRIVPIDAWAMLWSKIVKNATLKVYNGAAHGMCTTHKNISRGEQDELLLESHQRAIAASFPI
jgi:pimeloyl-ACP methyl ester carboxylesterase